MGGFCGCQFSTRPDGPGLICNEPAKHRGPHQAHGVTWPQLFEPTRGGDYDPRDQVGVEDTGPAAAAGSTAGPPDLDHAIQATDAGKYIRMLRYLVDWPHATDGDEEIDAYEAGADALEELQATRDRLADLQKRHNDLAATIREWQLECIRLERERDEAETRLAAALDGPAAQEEDRGG